MSLSDIYDVVLTSHRSKRDLTPEELLNTTESVSTDNRTWIPDDIWPARVGFYGVGGTVFCVFGIIGNLLAIIVLSKYKQKSSAPLLLILLALFDIAYLTSEMILETIATVANGNLITRSYLTWLTPGYVIFFPTPFVAQTGTTFMTVTITVERYIAVVKPFLAPRICKRSNALKASAVILAWSIIYHIPRYLAYTYYPVFVEDTNTTKIVFNRTEFGYSALYNDTYLIWINFSLEFLLPSTILIVLNGLMLRALRQSQKMTETNGLTKSRRDGQRLTTMVFAVTTMFFICELFAAISLINVRRLNYYNQCSLPCNRFAAIADTMIIFNSASNFILYCAVAKRFRQIFVQTFCPCFLKWRLNRANQNSNSGHVVGSSQTYTTSQGHSKTRM